LKTLTPPEVYPKDKVSLFIIYDLRFSGSAERCLRELMVWRGPKRIEIVDGHHWALILYPGLTGKVSPQSHSGEGHGA
jgi:hypothetical protein